MTRGRRAKDPANPRNPASPEVRVRPGADNAQRFADIKTATGLSGPALFVAMLDLWDKCEATDQADE